MQQEVIGGFESTYLPGHDTDVLETTGHDRRWREDLGLLADMGMRRLRYPVRWHRIEEAQGSYRWQETDAILGTLSDLGLEPIVDLVHHTSYPRWLNDGFADPRFGDAYLRYCEAFATRYPDTTEYTLFNEPFSTLFLSGSEGIWPPYHKGLDTFVAMLVNAVPAIATASRMYRDLLPGAQHVYTDTCERHTGAGEWGTEFAAVANQRRFFVLDAILGRLDPDQEYASTVIEAGGAPLLDMEPGHVDVLGLDYYAHNQWHFEFDGGAPHTPTPVPLAELMAEYAGRYDLPCMLSETNIRGYASDRASWLKYTLEQCEAAAANGLDVRGYCWFPVIDSCDWDSLLFRCDGNVDPVGVFWLDDSLERRPSSMSASYEKAVRGTPAGDLPAYQFRRPVSDWIAGYLPQMAHWDWQPPPEGETCSNTAPEDERMELRIKDV